MTENIVEPAKVVARVGERTLLNRKNVPAMLDWVNNNPDKFNHQLDDFDKVVGLFNASLDNPQLDPKYRNILELQKLFGTLRIPTIKSLANSATGSVSTSGAGLFIKAMREMNYMMQRGETTKEEPFLSFHTMDIPAESLVVGGIIHGYEEIMNKDKAFAGKFPHDGLVDGLIEALSMVKDGNSLYSSVAEVDKLDWVNGYDGFTLEMRHGLGLT